MSEVMSLDTRHRDDGGNYIADHDTYPQTVWFANGRRVSIDHTEVKSEIEGGRAYLQIDRNLHPAFQGQPPVGDVAGFKYLNTECGLSGCQWLVAEHQIDVYRKRMADMETELSRLRVFLDKCEAFLDCEGMASTSEEVAEVIERYVLEARG